MFTFTAQELNPSQTVIPGDGICRSVYMCVERAGWDEGGWNDTVCCVT